MKRTDGGPNNFNACFPLAYACTVEDVLDVRVQSTRLLLRVEDWAKVSGELESEFGLAGSDRVSELRAQTLNLGGLLRSVELDVSAPS